MVKTKVKGKKRSAETAGKYVPSFGSKHQQVQRKRMKLNSAASPEPDTATASKGSCTGGGENIESLTPPPQEDCASVCATSHHNIPLEVLPNVQNKPFLLMLAGETSPTSQEVPPSIIPPDQGPPNSTPPDHNLTSQDLVTPNSAAQATPVDYSTSQDLVALPGQVPPNSTHQDLMATPPDHCTSQDLMATPLDQVLVANFSVAPIQVPPNTEKDTLTPPYQFPQQVNPTPHEGDQRVPYAKEDNPTPPPNTDIPELPPPKRDTPEPPPLKGDTPEPPPPKGDSPEPPPPKGDTPEPPPPKGDTPEPPPPKGDTPEPLKPSVPQTLVEENLPHVMECSTTPGPNLVPFNFEHCTTEMQVAMETTGDFHTSSEIYFAQDMNLQLYEEDNERLERESELATLPVAQDEPHSNSAMLDSSGVNIVPAASEGLQGIITELSLLNEFIMKSKRELENARRKNTWNKKS